MKLKVDTGAEISHIREAWKSMLTSIGVELVIDARSIDIGWVNDSIFKVTSKVLLHVVLTGTNLAREIVFWVAPQHIVLDTLILGWKEVKNWFLLTQLERVIAT